MNCEQMTQLLSAWLDGELKPQEEMRMREHLEQCPGCRALYEQLQMLHTSFSDLEEIPAPDGFLQGVMSRVAEETKPKVIPLFKRPQVRAALSLAACAVLCIGIGSVALSGGFGGVSMDAATPEAAVLDLDSPTAAAAESAMDMPAEMPMEIMPDMETDATEAPAAAPEALLPQERYTSDATVEEGVQNLSKEQAVIILTELPEGLEAVLSQLQWEERIEDGALCAQLTDDQAEKLMELAEAQGLAVECSEPEEGAGPVWTLVLQPK